MSTSDNPPSKKSKMEIEPITWDPSEPEAKEDLRDNLNRKRKSPTSTKDLPTRTIHRKQAREQEESCVEVQLEQDTEDVKVVEQPDKDTEIQWYCRKCHLCQRPAKNMKNHLAFIHLKQQWWGILGEQTCWRCKQYHTLWKISHCEGFYMPMRDRGTFHGRHREFIDYLVEDFEASSPQQLVSFVRDMKLCKDSSSGFSDREEAMLRELDLVYGLTPLEKHDAQNPTRPLELIHWRTIVEMLQYLKERGALSSSMIPNKMVSLVDTRCDLIQEFERSNYRGPFVNFPQIRPALDNIKLKKVITEIVDPRQLNSSALSHLQADPMVKLTVGARPDLTHIIDSRYINHCYNMAQNLQVTAIGPVGIDTCILGIHIDRQASVFKEFIQMANSTGKPLRIYQTRNLDISLNLAKKGLPREHPVHIVNFTGSYPQAVNFTRAFKNGYFGLSDLVCNPPPYYVGVVKSLCIDRIVLESNAPYSRISNSSTSHSTDTLSILNAVARIKDIQVDILAKYIRRNVNNLYRF